MRGHGRSGGEKAESDYTWPSLARDLLGLLDVLGVDDAVSGIGSSMGTATLLHALTLGPRPLRPARAHLPADRVGRPRCTGRRLRAGALFVERNGKEAFLRGMRAQPRPAVLAEAAEGPVDIDEALLPTVLRGAAASDLPAPEAIAAIRRPTLILAWDGDPRGTPSRPQNGCMTSSDSYRRIPRRSGRGGSRSLRRGRQEPHTARR